jgi:hypothetical protein
MLVKRTALLVLIGWIEADLHILLLLLFRDLAVYLKRLRFRDGKGVRKLSDSINKDLLWRCSQCERVRVPDDQILESKTSQSRPQETGEIYLCRI